MNTAPKIRIHKIRFMLPNKRPWQLTYPGGDLGETITVGCRTWAEAMWRANRIIESHGS